MRPTQIDSNQDGRVLGVVYTLAPITWNIHTSDQSMEGRDSLDLVGIILRVPVIPR